MTDTHDTRPNMPLGLAQRGYTGIIQQLSPKDAGSALSDIELEMSPLPVSGDQACVEWIATATHSGPLAVDDEAEFSLPPRFPRHFEQTGQVVRYPLRLGPLHHDCRTFPVGALMHFQVIRRSLQAHPERRRGGRPVEHDHPLRHERDLHSPGARPAIRP